MKPTHPLCKLIIFFGLFAVIAGCNSSTKQISGKVAVAGHEPFTFVAVTTSDKTGYRIVGPLAKELAQKYQGRSITLEGKITKQSVGPGFPAEFTATGIRE